jgi:hypothetical protein
VFTYENGTMRLVEPVLRRREKKDGGDESN